MTLKIVDSNEKKIAYWFNIDLADLIARSLSCDYNDVSLVSAEKIIRPASQTQMYNLVYETPPDFPAESGDHWKHLKRIIKEGQFRITLKQQM